MAKGVTMAGPNSDVAKQICAAAQSDKWRWPSDMHKYAQEKARMKDIGVMLIAVMQKLLRDRKGFYPVMAACAAANAVSAILIFSVGGNYWTPKIGLLLSVLYVISIWPYLIILDGGFQGIAQMFFLFSVFCLQQAELLVGSTGTILWQVAAGAAFGFMNFSSASARKLIPLYLAAFFYSQRNYFEPFWVTSSSTNFSSNIPAMMSCVTAVALGVFAVLLLFSYRRLIAKAYSDRKPNLINRLFRGAFEKIRQKPIEIAIERSKFYVSIFAAGAGVIALFLLVSVALFRAEYYYASFIANVSGFFAVVAILLFPNFIRNIEGYFHHYSASNWSDHYGLYDEYFKAKNLKPFKNAAGGFKWYLRFFSRIAPFHAAFFLFASSFLVYEIFKYGPTIDYAMVLLLGVSAIIWGEVTKSPKAAPAYFPAFIGLLIPVGQAVYISTHRFSGETTRWFQPAVIFMVITAAVWNLWVFLDDCLPSKMAVAWLNKKLRSLKVKNFHTYKTPYNNVLVDLLLHSYPGSYEVKYIESLSEVSQGYLVVPPTSSKGCFYQSSEISYKGDFFDSDATLNSLFGSRDILKYAVSSFKTLGSSRIWFQHGPITSYRDLIFREVSDYDRWRGKAWIIDAERLFNDLKIAKA